MEKNIFEKIRDKEAPAKIVFENEFITAFEDIDPNAPVHVLIIPNKKISSLNEIEDQDSLYFNKFFFLDSS